MHWPARLRHLLAVVLLCPAWPGAAAATAALQPCRIDGVAHETLCGQVRRALDPGKPQDAQIDVHFAVLPALARQKKPDPVFFLAGGPGQSAIGAAGPVGGLLARFGNRRDIVLVDQRGTGRSAALRCEDDRAPLPLSESADPQRQVQRMLRCRDALQALPHGDLRQYTTSIAIADLEAVRLALAAPAINLVGVSYGTRAALEYMRQFPKSVRRVVLDGVAPPDMSLPEASAFDAQAAFDAMLLACEDDAACRARHPRLRATWKALLGSLPRAVAVPHPLTGRVETLTWTRDMVLGMVRTALYLPALSAALPAALDAAARGSFTPLTGLASAVGSGRGPAAIAQGMHFAVICSEDMPSASALAPAADFGSELARPYREVCAGWPRGAVPAGFYSVPPAPAAVLVLSGGIDPVTPPRHGERVARALGPLARHEVVAQAGHGLLSIPCLRETMFRFIDAPTDAAALQVGTDCARDVPRPPAFVPPGLASVP
jgi:pimeloyl-ACP methyl ester carboxylesterase